MQVFPGGSRNLEALPGVGRAPVQQLGPSDVVLARDADLPVAIDHKLGAAILQGWKREKHCFVLSGAAIVLIYNPQFILYIALVPPITFYSRLVSWEFLISHDSGELLERTGSCWLLISPEHELCGLVFMDTGTRQLAKCDSCVPLGTMRGLSIVCAMEILRLNCRIPEVSASLD